MQFPAAPPVFIENQLLCLAAQQLFGVDPLIFELIIELGKDLVMHQISVVNPSATIKLKLFLTFVKVTSLGLLG